mmetsp:Transcript_44964/g.104014  ORF Transcript_44964/g.104014 Transcript_44964/m.104014 type:complete len:236 (+) Transcript_44964:422-1129(+)
MDLCETLTRRWIIPSHATTIEASDPKHAFAIQTAAVRHSGGFEGEACDARPPIRHLASLHVKVQRVHALVGGVYVVHCCSILGPSYPIRYGCSCYIRHFQYSPIGTTSIKRTSFFNKSTFFVPNQCATPISACRIHLGIIEPLQSSHWWISWQLQHCSCLHIKDGEAFSHSNAHLVGAHTSDRHHRTDKLGGPREVKLLGARQSRIIPVELSAIDVQPQQPLATLIPYGSFSKIR